MEKSRSELYEEVERIFRGLSEVEVNVSGHLMPCPYRTFLNRLTIAELEQFLETYNPEKIKEIIRNGYEIPELPELVFGPNATTQQYARKGLREIEERLGGLKLPRDTPYSIIQAILKSPKSLLD